MNEDWLHKVHDRMTDYEIDEPENLWDALESKRTETSSIPRSVKRSVMIWGKRSMAAAAMIAVVITVGFYLVNMKNGVSETQQLTEATKNYVSGDGGHPQKHTEHTTTPELLHNNLITQVLTSAYDIKTESSFPSVKTEVQELIIDNGPAENQDKQSLNEDKSTDFDDVAEKRGVTTEELTFFETNDNHMVSIYPESPLSNKFSVSVYSSGGTGTDLNYNSKSDSFASIGPNDSDWEDNPLLGILVFNQGKDIKTDIKHHLPIKAGISFAYNFNRRLGIETGLSYTRLISDIKEGSESHYYTGKQKLHYIGIPLNLKYRMFSWKRFDFYATAGVFWEKCISAKLDKEFILDHRNKGAESTNLSEKPTQWSVNASLGTQCNIVNSMSIFVEPGISYYFNDGTNIKTIYNDKPLNFNLNLGIRFTFGK